MNQTGQNSDINYNINYTNYWTNNGYNSTPILESNKDIVYFLVLIHD
jgi:hypothetical protein